MIASQRRPSQVHASPFQTESRVINNLQLATPTCFPIWPGAKPAEVFTVSPPKRRYTQVPTEEGKEAVKLSPYTIFRSTLRAFTR